MSRQRDLCSRCISLQAQDATGDRASPQAGRDPIVKADGQTLEAFYLAHYDRIYQYVHRSVRNRQEAEDLTSQIFLKVVSSMEGTRGAKMADYWLLQLTRTTMADYWRTRDRLQFTSLEVLVVSGWQGPAVNREEKSTAASERVHLLLQALPPRYREVLTCRFLLQLSIRDTALRMGLTTVNIKVLQLRALARAAELAPGFLP